MERRIWHTRWVNRNRGAFGSFAVKPQNLDEVASAYGQFAGGSTVFLSIAAGKTISGIQSALGAEAPIVRCMPNTPAQVNRGITVACANALVGDDQRRLCQDLLEAVGEAAWVEDESLLDAVTAVSGSGPAYAFLLAECMAEAGVAAGLPEELSGRLARASAVRPGRGTRIAVSWPKWSRTPAGWFLAPVSSSPAPARPTKRVVAFDSAVAWPSSTSRKSRTHELTRCHVASSATNAARLELHDLA